MRQALTRRRRVIVRDESGVTIIIFALALVMLLTFVAFSVDLGGAYTKRRETQSAVDAGALAAALKLPNTTSASTELIDIVNKNLGSSGTVGWNTCTSAVIPSGFTADSNYNCIAYNTASAQVWARVPNSNYNTAFAKVAGIKTVTISAQAIATAKKPTGFGGVLPFGVPATGGGASYGLQCIKDGSGGPAGNCFGNVTGAFGYLDFNLYGSTTLGTSTCSGNGKTVVNQNIAAGIDHPLSLLSDTSPGYNGVEADDSCSPTVVNYPNGSGFLKGNDSSIFSPGILMTNADPTGTGGFSDHKGARLVRVGDLSRAYYDRVTDSSHLVNGYAANDTGLWEFIPTGLSTSSGIPASCERETFNQVYSTYSGTSSLKTRMETALTSCFNDYGEVNGGSGCGSPAKACTGQVFTNQANTTTSNPQLYDIQLSPRFSYVPLLSTDFPTTANGTVTFKQWLPIYIQTVYSGGPDSSFSPGVGDGPTSSSHADSVSSFAIYPSMLPGTLGTKPFNTGAGDDMMQSSLVK